MNMKPTFFERVRAFLFCPDRQHDTNETLTQIIMSSLLDSTIIYVTYERDGYQITVGFNNGVEITGWNKNRYYSWLSGGVITINGVQKLTWSGSMPSRVCMYRLACAIRDYHYKKISFQPKKGKPSLHVVR